MSANGDTLDLPPFPTLTWTKYGGWEGHVRLPAWAGFLARGGAYGAASSPSPSDGVVLLNVGPPEGMAPSEPSTAQGRAFLHQLDHGEAVVAAVLRALPTYYEELRPRWEDFYSAEEMACLMPPVGAPEEFRRLIGLSGMHVHPWQREGLGYVGLEFGCTWDEEHGLGVMLHGSRVVDIGAADTSFAWEPREADGAGNGKG